MEKPYREKNEANTHLGSSAKRQALKGLGVSKERMGEKKKTRGVSSGDVQRKRADPMGTLGKTVVVFNCSQNTKGKI